MPALPVTTFPTCAALPSSHRIHPSHPLARKALLRLSRLSLLSLASEWLHSRNQQNCAPVLASDDDDFGDDEESDHELAQSLSELEQAYTELRARKGGKRDIADRIAKGDWRNGLSLQQLAMLDVRYLLDHPTSQRWTALRLVKVITLPPSSKKPTKANQAPRELDFTGTMPNFHASIFLKTLQSEIGPLVRAHYYLTRLPSMPVTLLRIYASDSPYNTQSSVLADAYLENARSIYVAFPDGTHFAYISFGSTSVSGAVSDVSTGRNLRKLVLDAIPRALSRPHERYVFRTTNLSAKSISALVAARGAGRDSAAAGGWSIFANGTVDRTPLTTSSVKAQDNKETSQKENEELDKRLGLNGQVLANKRSLNSSAAKLPSFYLNQSTDRDWTPMQKRRKLVASARFGSSGAPSDGKGIERLDIRIEDDFSRMSGGDDTDADELAAPASLSQQAAPPRQAASPRQASRESRSGRRSTWTIFEDSDRNEGLIADDDDDDDRAEVTEKHAFDGKLRSRAPKVQLAFHGTHIFAGIRTLVEIGVIDGERMPGWMTGESSVSIGVVRNGVIMGDKGSGV